jgi:hypothetical protein
VATRFNTLLHMNTWIPRRVFMRWWQISDLLCTTLLKCFPRGPCPLRPPTAYTHRLLYVDDWFSFGTYVEHIQTPTANETYSAERITDVCSLRKKKHGFRTWKER